MKYFKYITTYLIVLQVVFYLVFLFLNKYFGIDIVSIVGLQNYRNDFHPWQWETFTFIHYNGLHLILNLSYLAGIGFLLEPIIGPVKIMSIYLFGMLFSIFGFEISCESFGNYNSILIGCSGSCMALLAAATHLIPEHKISIFGLFDMKILLFSSGVIAFELTCLLFGFLPAVSHTVHLVSFFLSIAVFNLRLKK